MPNTETNIEKLYDQYSGNLFFTSLRITGNSCDAEEIMHDTLLTYYHYPRKDEIQELKKWLTSICIRKSIDVLRLKNKNSSFLESYADENENRAYAETEEKKAFERYREEKTKIAKIKEALGLLPDKYRLILSLHLFEGYDYNEIEQITGIKENYIRGLYMRGKIKLTEIFNRI